MILLQWNSLFIQKPTVARWERSLTCSPSITRHSCLNSLIKKVHALFINKGFAVRRFCSFLDIRNFTIAITKVKSGRGASVFSVRTEDSSALQYFQFYGYLSQQQNMLQDFVRTYTYQRAILSNLNDFKVKLTLKQ